jgi:hypothetical protein
MAKPACWDTRAGGNERLPWQPFGRALASLYGNKKNSPVTTAAWPARPLTLNSSGYR